MPREREVSTRLIRPTNPFIDQSQLLLFVDRWNPSWEIDGSIKIFDEGIAQYMLADLESHYKYFASLILGKPSLRCQMVGDEPADDLDENGNKFELISQGELNSEDVQRIELLKMVLSKRGYRF
ncbi:unnamed protein product [Auanema sp. JU1783]|nr:unnamed protein product [Auanema sp. JU1783]